LYDIQTFESAPIFSPDGVNIEPDAFTYTNGFLPEEALPAQWFNWFMYVLTKNGTIGNPSVNDILTELKALLAEASLTPNVAVHTQVRDAVLAIANRYVKLTTNETIAGIKTFTSVPVLPASDPTTANQAVRKSYVDAREAFWKDSSAVSHSLTISTSEPSGGSDGDIWFVREA